jgi:hypothetical protein
MPIGFIWASRFTRFACSRRAIRYITETHSFHSCVSVVSLLSLSQGAPMLRPRASRASALLKGRHIGLPPHYTFCVGANLYVRPFIGKKKLKNSKIPDSLRKKSRHHSENSINSINSASSTKEKKKIPPKSLAKLTKKSKISSKS